MRKLAITAVGPDRPGIVDELSRFLLESGGNIADSRMVNLHGQFAIILLVEAPEAAAMTLERGLAEVASRLKLQVTVAGSEGPARPARPGLPLRLRTYAMDQPGIVHRFTHLLHARGINIEELETHLEAGSVSGTPLFTMELRLTVPPEQPVKALRSELEALCDSLNCDMDLDPG